jgi:hypothetical protein
LSSPDRSPCAVVLEKIRVLKQCLHQRTLSGTTNEDQTKTTAASHQTHDTWKICAALFPTVSTSLLVHDTE